MTEFLELISHILPVTVAGLVLGAGMPALFALGLRISAGRTEVLPGGQVVQTEPPSAAARALSWLIYAVIVGIILAGILWITQDFLYSSTGWDVFGTQD